MVIVKSHKSLRVPLWRYYSEVKNSDLNSAKKKKGAIFLQGPQNMGQKVVILYVCLFVCYS